MPQTVKKKPAPKGNNLFRWIIFTFLLVLCCGAIASVISPQSPIEEVPLSDVIARANDENGNIEKITVEGSNLKITLKGNKQYTQVSRKDTAGTLYEQGLTDQCLGLNGDELISCQAKYPTIEYVEVSNFWDYALDIAIIVVPVIIIILFFSSMMRQAQSMNNQSMGFGKAKAKLYGPDKKKVLFSDVAGNEAAKQDLAEVVDFLKEPKKIRKARRENPSRCPSRWRTGHW